MSLFDDASLVMIPSGYKEDVVYSVKPTDGSGDLTFTRASNGTRVNSSGYVENVPWNLVQQSNTFSTTWSKVNSSVTSGQSGYDGSSNAWLLEKSTYNGQININASNTGQTTFSLYMKAGTSQYGVLVIGAPRVYAFFDLSAGTTGFVTSGATSSITSIGGGWYRCSVTIGYCSYVEIYQSDTNTSITGTSGNIYVQDAQVNQGSLKPYFPTTDRQNVPRLTYEGGCPSLLLEPQRTNLLTYSEQFDNAAWVKGLVSISANTTTSPDGTQNADSLIDNTTNSRHVFEQAITGDLSISRAFSVYAKQNTLRYLYMSVTNAGDTHCYSAIFDLQSGTVSATKVNGSATITAKIESIGNGWYRCAITGTMTSGTATFYPLIGTSDRGGFTGTLINNNAPAYAGSSQSLYLWGAQLEAGSYPTSYIPTTSAAVTRVADAAYKTGISSLIGQTEGTLFVELKHSITNTTEDTRFVLSNNSYDNWLFFSIENGTSLRYYMTTAGVNLLDTTISNVFPTAGVYKVALAYQDDLFTIYVNGVQKVNNTNSTTIPAMSAFLLSGKEAVTSAVELVNKQVNQAALFKTRLTNDQLAALTTL